MSWYWPPMCASSGFGIQVGQYTGAWILFASACQPCSHAAGQLAARAGDAAGTATTSAAAATTPTRAALMPDRVAPSDFGWRPADERRDVAGLDDHGVAACVFELLHVVRRRQREVGDRELAGRDRGEQLEHDVERGAILVGLDGRQQEDLRVDALERLLDLLLVAHLDGAVETERNRMLVQILEASVLVVQRVENEHDGVSRAARPLERHIRAPEDRERGRVAHRRRI